MISQKVRFLTESVWGGSGVVASLSQIVLSPLSLIFGLIVRIRNRRYDRRLDLLEGTRGALARMAVPALSVGNLTVGGTGKTPLTSWFAQRLAALGGHPGIVLRGHGDDEWRVHTILTPSFPVEVGADRVDSTRRVALRNADCVVLDDAFQHRRARRVSDIVLVSADTWLQSRRLLPAGPFREPVESLKRATAVIVTAKAVSDENAVAVKQALGTVVSEKKIAVVQIRPGRLHQWLNGADGIERDTGELSDEDSEAGLEAQLAQGPITIVSAVGDPESFERQLRRAGADVSRHFKYPDHHRFSLADVRKLVRVTEPGEMVVCTLKDAVKLGPLWPRFAPPLWYLSQRIVVASGAELLDRECLRVLAARRDT